MTRREKVNFIKTSWGLKSDAELGLRLGINRKTIHFYITVKSDTFALLIDTLIENIELKGRAVLPKVKPINLNQYLVDDELKEWHLAFIKDFPTHEFLLNATLKENINNIITRQFIMLDEVTINKIIKGLVCNSK